MPGNTDSKAFQELVRVLTEALRAGVTAIGLEYKDGDLMVFYQAGPLSVGADRIARELQQDVIGELVKKARLRRSRGKIRASLLGKDFDVVVARYDSFGESAYNLTLKERKKT
jgi:hypothetical protein